MPASESRCSHSIPQHWWSVWQERFTALAMLRVKSALDAWWNLQGIFTGGMLGLFLLGLISKRASNASAVLAVVAGILMILWLSLSKTDLWPSSLEGMVNPLHSFMTIVVGTSSIVVIGILAASLMGKSAARSP